MDWSSSESYSASEWEECSGSSQSSSEELELSAEGQRLKHPAVGVPCGVGGRLMIVLAVKGAGPSSSLGEEGCRRVLFLRGSPMRSGAGGSIGTEVGASIGDGE